MLASPNNLRANSVKLGELITSIVLLSLVWGDIDLLHAKNHLQYYELKGVCMQHTVDTMQVLCILAAQGGGRC